MTTQKAKTRARRLPTLLGGALALAYLALPPLVALHQAQHLSEQLAAAEHRTQAVAASVGDTSDSGASCEICQSAARSKHTGALTDQPTAFLQVEASPVVVARHEPHALGGRSPPSVRAPPLV